MNIWVQFKEYWKRPNFPEYTLDEETKNGETKYVIWGKIGIIDYIEISRFSCKEAAIEKFNTLCETAKLKKKIEREKTSRNLMKSDF